MFDIVQITHKHGVLRLEDILKEYTLSLGKEDKNSELLVSIFTRFDNPGTLLLVAIKDDEPVGFLWAQPISQFGESYLRISEIYAKKGMLGTKLFERALDFARSGGHKSLKGMVSVDKVDGMERLFKAKTEAVLISVEINYD